MLVPRITEPWTFNERMNRWERVVGILGLVVQQFEDGWRWHIVGGYTAEKTAYYDSKESAMRKAEECAYEIASRIKDELKLAKLIYIEDGIGSPTTAVNDPPYLP